MQRLRELLAHGGIAILALVFALAFALYDVANQVAFVVIGVIEQHALDDEGKGLSFTVAGTTISYVGVLQTGIAALVLVAVLYAIWKVTRRNSSQCPECLSDVPARASICRYCTSERPSLTA